MNTDVLLLAEAVENAFAMKIDLAWARSIYMDGNYIFINVEWDYFSKNFPLDKVLWDADTYQEYEYNVGRVSFNSRREKTEEEKALYNTEKLKEELLSESVSMDGVYDQVATANPYMIEGD